jgi:hypothetical protein
MLRHGRDTHDTLKDSNVKIREDDDQLVWSLNPTGNYVAHNRLQSSC